MIQNSELITHTDFSISSNESDNDDDLVDVTQYLTSHEIRCEYEKQRMRIQKLIIYKNLVKDSVIRTTLINKLLDMVKSCWTYYKDVPGKDIAHAINDVISTMVEYAKQR